MFRMSFIKSRLKQYIVFALALAACFHGQACLNAASAGRPATQNQEQPLPASDIDQGKYLLGPDDQIRMTVFGEEDLSGNYTVNAGGMLSVPLIGDVQARGRTLKQVEAEIVRQLKSGYLVNPSVALEIGKYRPFYILGEVRAPGSYSYVTGMNALNAAALAGGFTYRANKKRIQIRRADENGNDVTDEQPVEYKIRPGDVILVKERFF